MRDLAMTSIIAAAALAVAILVYLVASRSLPETVRLVDPDRPDERSLSWRGLGILAVMIAAMAGGVMLFDSMVATTTTTGPAFIT
jgi:hypothetical protein